MTLSLSSPRLCRWSFAEKFVFHWFAIQERWFGREVKPLIKYHKICVTVKMGIKIKQTILVIFLQIRCLI
jgi:hypothetical protein